jgi:predicted dehydrogenase
VADKVRIGLIGASAWGDFMLVPALKSHAGAELVAVSSRNRGPLEAFAARHGIPQTFTDHRAMLLEGGLDAVIVASPDDQHKVHVLDVFDAGLHVMCEKPLALTLADAEEMLARARASGRIHLVPYTWRWQPHFRYLADLIASGHFGDVRRASFTFHGGWGNDPAYGWRADALRSGGVLTDLGSHMIDLALLMLGDLRRVSAHTPAFVRHEGVEVPANDAAHLVFETTSGAQGVIDVNANAQIGDAIVTFRVSVEGAKAGAEVEHWFGGAMDHVTMRGAEPGGPMHEIDIPASYYSGRPRSDTMGIYWTESVSTRLFIDAIIGGFQPKPDLETGVAVQRILDAAQRSNAERRWIDL